MKIYLSGPIFNTTYNQMKSWRNDIKRIFKSKATIIDPTRHDYRGKEKECRTYKKIVEMDINDILKSDIVLVNPWKYSVGTSMEIVYAKLFNKKVWVIGKKEELSPWLQYHGTRFFKDLYQLKWYVKTFRNWYND